MTKRKTLAEQMGISIDRCELCDGDLTDDEPWREGMDGARAHESCLAPYLKRRKR